MYGLNKNPCDNSNTNFRRIDLIDPNASEKWVTHGNSNLIFPYNLQHEDISRLQSCTNNPDLFGIRF